MLHEKVHVRIDKKTGIIKIEGEGFQGEGCNVLDQVENELGNRVSYVEKEEKYTYIQPDYIPNQLSN